ncbi:MAG: hypothetical protein JW863_23215 [Chitinispirillaceae bacterium]|nr:hypothetical protein [Chitinispirillaceae bacterium]
MYASPIVTTRIHFMITVFFAVNFSFANPIEILPITRLCYIDSLHWTIEFNWGELRSSETRMPEETELVTLGCTFDDSDEDHMQECALPIQINRDDSTGTVTPVNFPDLKLKPGCIVLIGTKDYKYNDRGPELPDDIQPNTIFEREEKSWNYCEEVNGVYTCYDDTYQDYVVSECQTYTRGNVALQGILTDKRNNPLNYFGVQCFNDLRKSPVASCTTQSGGAFLLGYLDSCPPHILKLSQLVIGSGYHGYTIDYTALPIGGNGSIVRKLNIQIDYPPTGTVEQQSGEMKKKASAISLLTSSGGDGNPLVITVSDNSLKGKGSCRLYSLSGELIGTQTFTSRGIGTYTINWNETSVRENKFPAATYICHIAIGSEHVCIRFIKRRP